MKRTTITATDRIVRKESITFLFNDAIADQLQNAANQTYPDGMPCSELSCELSKLYDDYRYGYGGLTRSQFIRLRDFYNLVDNKFCNYSLTIAIK